MLKSKIDFGKSGEHQGESPRGQEIVMQAEEGLLCSKKTSQSGRCPYSEEHITPGFQPEITGIPEFGHKGNPIRPYT